MFTAVGGDYQSLTLWSKRTRTKKNIRTIYKLETIYARMFGPAIWRLMRRSVFVCATKATMSTNEYTKCIYEADAEEAHDEESSFQLVVIEMRGVFVEQSN